MDLRNCLPHMRGASVKVGETVYRIDADGVVRDVAREHAAIMLRNRAAWQIHVDRKPVAAPTPATPVPEAAPQPPEEVVETPEVVEQITEPGGGGDTGLLDDVGEDIGAKEWPDPSEDLGIDYLRAMADAHGVKYSDRTKAKTLVKRLRAVMFE